MYTNPFFLSPAAGLDSLAGSSVLENMLKVGMNTGNMLFARAAQSVLAPQGWRRPRSGKRFVMADVEGNDCIVVSAANWLQPRTDLSYIADLVEEADLPAFVLGLGAQTATGGAIPELSDGTKRFLKVMSERSKLISVRGTFTAEVLNHYGVKNAEPTGCPSLLMMDEVPTRFSKPERQPRKIVLCGSRGAATEAQMTSMSPTHVLSRQFAKALPHEDVSLVAQAELPEINYLIQDQCSEADLRPEWVDFAERYYGLPEAELVPMLREKMKVFFTFPEWKAFLHTQDFVIGTRLHGIIAGLLSGTPSVLITHDSRTREMVEIMEIPALPSADVGDKLDYERAYAEADFERFNCRYPHYYRRFRDFFDANGLAHHLQTDV